MRYGVQKHSVPITKTTHISDEQIPCSMAQRPRSLVSKERIKIEIVVHPVDAHQGIAPV